MCRAPPTDRARRARGRLLASPEPEWTGADDRRRASPRSRGARTSRHRPDRNPLRRRQQAQPGDSRTSRVQARPIRGRPGRGPGREREKPDLGERRRRPPGLTRCGGMAAVRGSAQHSAKRPWRRKPAQVVAIATLACVIGAVGAIKVARNLFSGGDAKAAVVKSAPVAPVVPTTTLPPLDPNMTVLAAPKGTIGTYSSPGGTQSGTVGTWYGYPLVLPVIA